ncbi:MAG: YncE family protein [Polaromonas sp.]|nr:YncE family protein [Gemmatimonadaceae bacterium]
MNIRSPRHRLLAAVLVAIASVNASAQAPYHLVKRITTGGEGGWDYLAVEPSTHRLFVSRGSHVQVIDVDRDSMIADIGDTPGVHGIAFASALGRGFTSNGRDSTVTIFDLETLATISRVKVTGRNPDAILFDSASGRVFTFNGGSANATAIDAATGTVVGTVSLTGKPETGQSDGKGTIFVNIETKNEIIAFDARTLAVKSHITLPGCDEPTGMAIDRAKSRLYVGCGGNKTMAIVDYLKGALLTTVAVGEGVDANAFDPSSGLSFASGGDGTLAVVREDAPRHFAVSMVPTVRGARTMTLDPRTHRVYLSSAQYGVAPAPTAERPNPRPPMVPGSFTILVFEP